MVSVHLDMFLNAVFPLSINFHAFFVLQITSLRQKLIVVLLHSTRVVLVGDFFRSTWAPTAEVVQKLLDLLTT